MTFRRLGIWFLLAQAAAGAAWWVLLLVWPSSRALFLVKGAPDSTLLAFAIADLLCFIGLSIACAYGISTRRPWAWPLLCIHAGAAGYAALYCWTLVVLTGGQCLSGALLMTPSLFLPGLMIWKLREGQ